MTILRVHFNPWLFFSSRSRNSSVRGKGWYARPWPTSLLRFEFSIRRDKNDMEGLKKRKDPILNWGFFCLATMNQRGDTQLCKCWKGMFVIKAKSNWSFEYKVGAGGRNILKDPKSYQKHLSALTTCNAMNIEDTPKTHLLRYIHCLNQKIPQKVRVLRLFINKIVSLTKMNFSHANNRRLWPSGCKKKRANRKKATSRQSWNVLKLDDLRK